MSSKSIQVLDNDSIRRAAPSVFASGAHAEVSDRYSFLPTIEVVDRLRGEGWLPVSAKEQRIREQGRAGFQKHVLRFQRQSDVETYASQEVFQHAPSAHKIVKGEVRPEIVLVNSHDRSSAYTLHAGLFRLVCSNGLVIADATISKVSITHVNFDPAEVINASLEIAAEVPVLMESVEGFRARQLTQLEQVAFAEAAILLKYDDVKTAPIGADKVLAARRYEDNGNDLWRTFNRVQENLINGGQKDYTRRLPAKNSEVRTRRAPRTRAVDGIDNNLKLNKALWHLAEVLKAGGI